MTILLQDFLCEDVPLREIVQYDFKRNILECFKELEIEVPSRNTKSSLAEKYEQIFHDTPGAIIDRIPKSESFYLSTLLDCKQNEYIECPKDDENLLFIQKCYLVFTYETKHTWHLYMSDNIRHHIKRFLNLPVEISVLTEKSRIMDRFAEVSQEMLQLLGNNDPYSLSVSDAKVIHNKLVLLQGQMKSLYIQILALESELKANGTDVEALYNYMQNMIVIADLAKMGCKE